MPNYVFAEMRSLVNASRAAGALNLLASAIAISLALAAAGSSHLQGGWASVTAGVVILFHLILGILFLALGDRAKQGSTLAINRLTALAVIQVVTVVAACGIIWVLGRLESPGVIGGVVALLVGIAVIVTARRAPTTLRRLGPLPDLRPAFPVNWPVDTLNGTGPSLTTVPPPPRRRN